MDILFEIGLEEIPARFLRPALKDIEKLIKDELKEKRISVENIKTNGTSKKKQNLKEPVKKGRT